MKKTVKLFKKGAAGVLIIAMISVLMPIISKPQVVHAEGNSKNINLGTTVINSASAPDDGCYTYPWKGSYVYFGSYNGNPIKYRVLDVQTTDFSGDYTTQTMLLDCNMILWNSKFDDKSNVWSNSYLKKYLNSEGQDSKTGFLTNSFTAQEQLAIAKSTKATSCRLEETSKKLNYASLNGEKIFLLDATEIENEVYGYSHMDGRTTNRLKSIKKNSDIDKSYWLRTPEKSNSSNACYVDSDATMYNGSILVNSVNYSNIGVSPALNLKLSSVIFTSAAEGSKSSNIITDFSSLPGVSDYFGVKDGYYGSREEWKFTLLDSSVSAPIITNVERKGDILNFQYSGVKTGTNQKLSAIITSGSGASETIVSYGVLEDASSESSGSVTITLPSDWDRQNYALKVFSEQNNGDKNTDYAGAFAKVENISTKKSPDLKLRGTVSGKVFDDTPIFNSTIKDDLFTWNSDGTISYTYFTNNTGIKTTVANSGAISDGAAPKNVGTYYLKATLSENGEYSGAESDYIPFTIKLPLSGTGTEKDSYIIKTAADLSYLANSVRTGQNYSGKYFKLNNDITYSSMPIGCFPENGKVNSPFCGNFDGAGHTVTLAMTNNSSGMEQAVALFGYLGSGAVVENINTTGTITSSGQFSGGIAGVAKDGDINISNCSSNVEMNFSKGGDCTYGGIVGLINNSGNVTMTNCYFTGKITTAPGKGLEGVGGLCGWKSDTLNAVNCYVDASFGSSSITATGKYMSRNGGTFTNCYYNKEKTLTEDSSTNSTGNEAVTNDFTSGKIAWLLQNGQSNKDIQAWGQTLTGDKKDSAPVLSSASARAVHKVSYYQDNKELENGSSYVNSNTKITLRQISDLTPAAGCNDVVGWYKGNDTTTLLQPGSEQLITSDTTYCTLSVNKEIFYTINTQSKDSTLGAVEGGGKYVAGATVTLKAKPRMGCKFEKWSSDAEGNTVVSTKKTLKITANNSSTYYAWFAPDKYKLTVGHFNSSAGTVSGVKEEGYSYNEKAGLKAEANTGYAFDGWNNEYDVTVTTSSAFSFKVSDNMTITPIFTQIDENTTYYTAAFYHQSGDLLKSEKVAANSIVIPPNTPSKIGYDFIGWSIDGRSPVALNEDKSITITSNIVLKPLFKVKEVIYSLTVNGKQSTYSPLSSVTALVAEMDIPEGKQFAYWKDESDKIVSYNNPYNFSLTGDITLTAVYEDSTEAVIKKPTLTLSASTYELINATKHKMVWYAAMDLPKGYTLVESGILRMLSTTPQTNEQMTFDSEGIYRRIIQVSKSIPNQYYYSVAASDGKGVSVRAYIVVRDKDGNLETIFSDVQYGCHK